jgi:hypothetical protein
MKLTESLTDEITLPSFGSLSTSLSGSKGVNWTIDQGKYMNVYYTYVVYRYMCVFVLYMNISSAMYLLH